MVSRKITVCFITLLVITACLIIATSFLLMRIGSRAANVARSHPDTPEVWHIMLVAQRIDSPFWQEVYEGAKAVGDEHGAVIDLVGPASDADRKKPDDYMNYAAAVRADGILAYIHDSPLARDSLRLASQKGIPVITLENDVFNSTRQAFVGINSYELGKILGGLIRDAAGPSGNAALVLDESSIRFSENSMLSGIQEAIAAYPNLRLVPLRSGNNTGADYEEIMRTRILNDPGLNVIVTLNVEDTIRAAQAVVELNKTDRISIIAFRESKEILDYVRKGIVRAVVVIDAEQMGRKAASAMIEFLETKHSNDYVITDMHVITRAILELNQK